VVGFIDDFIKIYKQRSLGLRSSAKLAGQAVVGAVFAALVVLPRFADGFDITPADAHVSFLRDFGPALGLAPFVLWIVFLIAGTSNAVNLTDGLDGLATVPVIIVALSFGFISYLVGNSFFSEYLNIHYVAGTGELAVVCGAMIGAGLGFLWFNAPPASIFMGDTGSLALGGMIGTVAVATKHEIVLAVVGGLFVLEAVSVIVQVASYKLTGKRVFRMAPIHHHFEQLGWTEPQIVIRFWIISVVLALAGLSTLKLR
jgi:phospho-N-acetylmuramoyl-pentapeptide-transferase